MFVVFFGAYFFYFILIKKCANFYNLFLFFCCHKQRDYFISLLLFLCCFFTISRFIQVFVSLSILNLYIYISILFLQPHTCKASSFSRKKSVVRLNIFVKTQFLSLLPSSRFFKTIAKHTTFFAVIFRSRFRILEKVFCFVRNRKKIFLIVLFLISVFLFLFCSAIKK